MNFPVFLVEITMVIYVILHVTIKYFSQIISDTGVFIDIIGRIDKIYGISTNLTSTKFSLAQTNKNKMAKVQLLITNGIIECYVIVGFNILLVIS